MMLKRLALLSMQCSYMQNPISPRANKIQLFSDFTGDELALSHVTLQRTKACLPVVVPSAYPRAGTGEDRYAAWRHDVPWLVPCFQEPRLGSFSPPEGKDW